jgi:hypothetical protein
MWLVRIAVLICGNPDRDSYIRSPFSLLFSLILQYMNPMLVRGPNYEEEDELFWKQLVPCEEDRPRFTTPKQGGAFRWFRAPNVVPIEKYRRTTHRNASVVDAS